jgi:hypothetical protein
LLTAKLQADRRRRHAARLRTDWLLGAHRAPRFSPSV